VAGAFAGATLEYKTGTSSTGRSATMAAHSSGPVPMGRRSPRLRCVAYLRGAVLPLPHLSDLRVRASHGTAGNSPQFVAQYETYNCKRAAAHWVRPETRCSSLRPPRKRKPGRILLCSTAWRRLHVCRLEDEEPDFAGAHADGLWIQLAVAERRDAREQDIRDRAHSADCDAARFQLSMKGTWTRPKTWISSS